MLTREQAMKEIQKFLNTLGDKDIAAFEYMIREGREQFMEDLNLAGEALEDFED